MKGSGKSLKPLGLCFVTVNITFFFLVSPNSNQHHTAAAKKELALDKRFFRGLMNKIKMMALVIHIIESENSIWAQNLRNK